MTSVYEELSDQAAGDVPVRRVTFTVNGGRRWPTSSPGCCSPTCSARGSG